MRPVKIKENIFWTGVIDWDRRLFDALIPLPDGTTYNSFLIKGSEKTALLDTVEPAWAAQFMARLEGVEKIDYVVSHHAEQDHSGCIPQVLEKYPGAKVITTPKGRDLLMDHLKISSGRFMMVNDGQTISLGDKTLEFIHIPWVHWPETMATYLYEDRMLFTCDLFGSHLASSGLYVDDHSKVCEAAKRYYAEVMMPFRSLIKKHMEKLSRYRVEIIAPSHGPLHNHAECILESHRDWVSDKLSNTAVIPYVSMHGSTERMADYLTEALNEKGVNVERFNLAYADNGKLAMAIVDAATIVIGSPTVLTGAHPLAVSAAFLVNALKPKLKFASIIGSYGWGGKMSEQISAAISGLKVEFIEPVLVKGTPKESDFKLLLRLADTIAARHREHNISPGGSDEKLPQGDHSQCAGEGGVCKHNH